MSIWDFSEYDTKDLFKIRDSNAILSQYGLGLEDDAEMELEAELERRED